LLGITLYTTQEGHSIIRK